MCVSGNCVENFSMAKIAVDRAAEKTIFKKSESFSYKTQTIWEYEPKWSKSLLDCNNNFIQNKNVKTTLFSIHHTEQFANKIKTRLA